MKDNTYHNAVSHLIFSDRIYREVLEKTSQPQNPMRFIRCALLAVVLSVLLGTTVFAVSRGLIERRVDVVDLGSDTEPMQNEELMKITVKDGIEGVKIHYLKLEGKGTNTCVNGVVHNSKEGFFRITEDYRLEPVESETIQAALEKNGRVYNLEFEYIETENGIVSNHKSVYRKNENDEILLHALDTAHNSWPVYVNLETGQLRDALPGWDAEDFGEANLYAYMFGNGILIDSGNIFYWLPEDLSDKVEIRLPEKDMWSFVDNENLLCIDAQGKLYRMNNTFAFELISEYKTQDIPTNGLLTVRTASGELGIYDSISDVTYVVDGLHVNADELDETMGYNASRYGINGKISLVYTLVDYEKEICRIEMIGILDQETGLLKMLQIQNEFDGYHNHWLDENRYAVRYKVSPVEEYLCIYEFVE